MTEKLNVFFERVVNWLGKRNWGIVTGIFLFMLFIELLELFHTGESLADPFHLIEIVVIGVILALLGVLINFYINLNAIQKRTMEILDFKHALSLKLMEIEEWETLIAELVKLPGSIANISLARLFVFNPISGEIEIVDQLNEDTNKNPIFLNDCRECIKYRKVTDPSFKKCCFAAAEQLEGKIKPLEYCLSISSGNSLLGLIQFQLQESEILSDDQMELFDNIRPEIALAFKAAWEHKRHIEMQITKTALAERHTLSSYLHDNLSQNLAYLTLKLDQMTNWDERFTIRQAKNDLQTMKSVARESHKIVRGMLEKIYPVTTPHLINLIREHSKKVSSRTDIEIMIEETGKAVSVLPEVQQTIFYVFQEALSNVEKHAQAKNVTVHVNWCQKDLTVKILDNGVGFNLQNLQQTNHFGLDIIRERVEKIDGRFDICSSINTGTEITVVVPIALSQKEGIDG